MKKKIISIILVAGMAVSLAACSNTEETKEVATETAAGSGADTATEVAEEKELVEDDEITDNEASASSATSKDTEAEEDVKEADADTTEADVDISGENMAYVDDDGNIVLDITSYDDSYFGDNDIHLRRLEVNSDEPYIYDLSTYGTLKVSNDIWITKNVAAQIDIIADEEEGYVDTIFTATISGIKNVDYLLDRENYDDLIEDGASYTYTIRDNVFDFYTGASLYTYYQVGDANPEEEEHHGTAKVELSDGTEGYISTWTTYEYTDDGKAVKKIFVKHPVKYDGVVFLLSPGYEAVSDEEIAWRNSERGADVEGEISYAHKAYEYTDGYTEHERNYDYLAPDKTAAELGID